MCNSFKNFRRGTSKENETAVPPPKRRRLYDSDCEEISEEEYHEAVKELQGCYSDYGKMIFSFIYILYFEWHLKARERKVREANMLQ